MTRLGTLVQEALAQLEWAGDLTDDEAAGTSQLQTLITLDDQPCSLYIDTREETNFIGVFFYPPFRAKAAAYPETCLLINAINSRTRHGHLEVLRHNGRLRMVVSADVKGANPTGVFVAHLMRYGADCLLAWMGELAAVAVGNRRADDVLAELEQDAVPPTAPAEEEGAACTE